MSDDANSVYELFAEAWRLPPKDRAEHLDLVCQGKQELRGQVELLLSQAEQAQEEDFFAGDPEESLDPAPGEFSRLFSSLNALEVSEAQPAGERSPEYAPQGGRLNDGANALSQLGDHILLEELGRGGMGRVYRARHKYLNRVDAVKVVSEALVSQEGTLERFQREIAIAGQLNHPNIVRATHAGEDNGMLYLVMEYIQGVDLQRVINHRKPLPFPLAVDLVKQVAHALQYAHDHGLVHRDIKPANLILCHNQRIVVLDFGLARVAAPNQSGSPSDPRLAPLSYSGQLVGTADYMAPEQVQTPRDVDGRADIYSLGCTLYALLSGTGPFADRPTTWDKLRAHCEEEPGTLTSIPENLRQIVLRMMAKQPYNRYQSSAEVAQDLQQWLNLSGVPPTIPEWIQQLLPDSPRQPPSADHVGAAPEVGFRSASRGSARPDRPEARANSERPHVDSSGWAVPSAGVLLILAALLGLGFGAALTVATIANWKPPEGEPPLPEPFGRGSPSKPSRSEVNLEDALVSSSRPQVPILTIDHQFKDQRGPYQELPSSKLPVRGGDRFQLHAELPRPGYLYLIWYDATGKAQLMWPKKDALDKPEKLREVWDPEMGPPDRQKWHRVDQGPSGYELILAAVTDSPLERETVDKLLSYRCLLCIGQRDELKPLTAPQVRAPGALEENLKFSDEWLLLVIPKVDRHSVAELSSRDPPVLAEQRPTEVRLSVVRGAGGPEISPKFSLQRFETVVLSKFLAHHGWVYPFQNDVRSP